MKKHWLITAATAVVFLASCRDPSGNDPGNKPNNPDQKTTIVFDNTQGICAVSVYSYYSREEEDKIADILPGQSSGEIKWAPGDSVPFYFSYSVNIKGISGFTLNYVPEIGKDQKAIRIDADKKTIIKIPPLSETLSSPNMLFSNNSFLFIQNNSFYSFILHRGNTRLKPENISSPMVNDGETAQYTIDSGSAADFRLLAGTTYYYFPDSLANFKAGHIYKFVFDGGISQVSDTELKLENVTGVTIPQAPDAPAVITSNGRISLRWAAVEGATIYEVWMSRINDPTTAVKYGDDISTSLSATINGLNNGTKYYIWLKAKNSFGTSGFSPAAMGTPSASSVKPPNPETPPVIIAGNGQLTVSWQAVEDTDMYEVWAGTANYAQTAVKQGEDVSGLSTVISGLNNGTTYYVWTRAKNNIGISGFSPSASGKPLGTPRMPTLTPGYKSLTVTWTAVAGADQYEVYYGIDTPTTLAITTAGTTATITGLTDGTTYFVRLRAKNANGISEYGAGASGVPDNNLAPGLYRGDVKIGNQNLSTALPWISSNAVNGDELYIVLGANETISPTNLSYPGKTVGITLLGSGGERTISLSANGSMFTVYSGVTLTVDENITLMGRNANNASLVYVYGGNLIMNDKAKITGNNAGSSRGGGIFINSGNFTMNGGGISGNTASSTDYSSYGGGVYVSSGTFTMNGGEVSGNTSRSPRLSYGGGVYVSSGTFTMSSGEISGNTSSSYSNYYSDYSSYGGGVYVTSGTFTMNGGKISGNTSSSRSSYGGGVYVGFDETFTMSGGKISGNTSSSNFSYSYGGGVYVKYEGTFTMSSGEISGNTASYSSSYYPFSYGGGVYVDGIFTKSSGTITGYASDTMNGNVVKNSSGVVQSNRGHAVYMDSPVKHRETTTGPGVNMDSRVSGTTGGWE
jgi:hypothetical protein